MLLSKSCWSSAGEHSLMPTQRKVNNILIVDDDDNDRVLTKRVLQELFPVANLFTCTDGHQAIECCKEKIYDVVFMDLNMPGIGGIETIMQIRNFGYKNAIYILTSGNCDQERELCQQIDCNGYFQKTTNTQQLEKLLCELVNLSIEKL